jgi:hypothetical protein
MVGFASGHGLKRFDTDEQPQTGEQVIDALHPELFTRQRS